MLMSVAVKFIASENGVQRRRFIHAFTMITFVDPFITTSILCKQLLNFVRRHERVLNVLSFEKRIPRRGAGFRKRESTIPRWVTHQLIVQLQLVICCGHSSKRDLNLKIEIEHVFKNTCNN